jgi:hypothetical protein
VWASLYGCTIRRCRARRTAARTGCPGELFVLIYIFSSLSVSCD